MRKSQSSRESGVPIPLNSQRPSYFPRNRSSSVDMRSRASGSLPAFRRSVSEDARPSIANCQIPRGMSPACGEPSLPGGLLFNRRSTIDKRLSKDPRPLTDKNFQSKCLISLVEFLQENGYPYPVSVKKLMSPSKKDFEMIFEFLCRFVDSKFQVVKIEDDATRMLKHLRYPFTVVKSTYASVTQRTWPTLLGILMWLVDLNKFQLNLEMKYFFGRPDFESGDEQYNLIKYILESYANNEDDPVKDVKVFTEFVNKRYPLDYTAEELVKMLDTTTKRRDELRNELDHYKQLQGFNKQKGQDIERLEEYIEKMKERVAQKEKASKETSEQCSCLETELKALQAEVAEKESAYLDQGFDGQHALNLYTMQKQELLDQLEEKNECIKKAQRDFWNLEIQHAQMLEKVSANCKRFNEAYSKRVSSKEITAPLKSIDMPAAVKFVNEFNIDLPDFDMKPSSSISEWDQVIAVIEKKIGYIEERKDCLLKIRNAQKNYMSELESRVSDLKIKEDLTKAQTLQKERDLEIKQKEWQRKIENLESKLAEIREQYDKTRRETLECEKMNSLLQQEITENHALIQKLDADYEIDAEHCEENFRIAVNKIKEFMKENNEILWAEEKDMKDMMKELEM